jgi:CheY-like chemotaxis protein
MEQVGPVLVVDRSAVAREYLQRILRLRCSRVDAVEDFESARRFLNEHQDYELVVADSTSPGGGGLALLEYLATRGGPKPAVVLLASRKTHDEEVRALVRGAVGYFPKPVSIRTLARVLKTLRQGPLPAADARAGSTPAAQAWLVDPADGSRPLALEVRDLSCSGALLATQAPISLGTRLKFYLVIDAKEILVDSEVVRVQEPTWTLQAGVAVSFRGMNEETRRVIDAYVARASAFGREAT